jgi:hypothetical protein
MDDVVNRFARELADAIAAAVAESPQVEACRERARAAGYEMKVTLEAVVGFANRSDRERSPVPALAADRRRRDSGACRVAAHLPIHRTPRRTLKAGRFVRAGLFVCLGRPAVGARVRFRASARYGLCGNDRGMTRL